MKKAVIVYESKYGNTKLVAEGIAEGMRAISETEVILWEVKSVDMSQLAAFDAILIGCPNHMGSAVSSIRKFVDNLAKVNLEGKQVAVFDTYMGGDFEKATKKMEKQIGQKAPGLKLISPSLSIRVEGMKGPIADAELPKSKEFGTRIATLMRG